MKAFICFATVIVAASAAPQFLGVVHARTAGQVSHQSVSKPFQGEHRSTTQSKAFGAGVAAVADSPNRLHGARGVVAHAPAFGGVHAIGHPIAHAVAHPVAIAHAPVLAHAPLVARPVVAHAAAIYPDEPNPYTYTYAVNDDYSGSRFDASESADGAGSVSGSYSVALPDGRTQHVTYNANGYDGYVADVTYDGVAAYADAPIIAHAAPIVARPVVHAVAHPVVHAVAHPVAVAAPVAVAHPAVGLIHG